MCTRLFRSTDAGRTWAVLASPDLYDDVQLTFATSAEGWLFTRHANHSDGTLWHTSDGGHSWARLPVADVTALATTDGRLMVLAHGALLIGDTADGSAPARLRRLGTATGDTIFVDRDQVYVYNSTPRLPSGVGLAAIDGDGMLPIRTPCRSDRTFSAGLAGTPAGALLLVCGSEAGAGSQVKQAYRSDDRGVTWQRVTAPGLSGYVGGGALSPLGAFFYGSRMTLHATFDSGRTWQTVLSGSAGAGGIDSAGFASLRFGWAVDDGPPATLYLSNDGGRTWTPAPRP